MYVVFAVLRLYVSALFPDFQPKHRPSAGRQRNLTEAQRVGFEPTRRTNARPDSNRLQFHYGNTAKFSIYRQRTLIVLFPRFLSRQRFHHKKNIIHYTKTRQPCHINNILQRMGKRGIEPPMFTTWELIYSQPQHRQSLPLPHNRHKTVSNMFYVLCVTRSCTVG